MPRFLAVCLSVMALAIAGAAGSIAWDVRQARIESVATAKPELAGIRKEALSLIDAQMNGIRTELFARVDAGIKVVSDKVGAGIGVVDKQATGIREMVDKQVTGLRGEMVAATQDATERTDGQLDRMNDTLENNTDRIAEQAEALNETAARVADSADAVARPAAWTVTSFNHNLMACQNITNGTSQPWCIPSRWAAMSGEAMRSEDATRQLLLKIDRFMELADDWTRRFVHPTKKEQLRDLAVAGGVALGKSILP